MPFEARKNMTWGPHRGAVELRAGDEVPSPVKRNLFRNGFVVSVEAVAGKKWCDQPEAARTAWAEEGGTTRLIGVAKEGEPPKVAISKIHPTQLVAEGDDVPVSKRKRPLPTRVEAPDRPLEPQEAAGGEVAGAADESAPPLATEPVDVEGTGLLEDTTAESVPQETAEDAPKTKKTSRFKRGRRSRR